MSVLNLYYYDYYSIFEMLHKVVFHLLLRERYISYANHGPGLRVQKVGIVEFTCITS